MQLTPDQVKGRIKNIAKQNDADARTPRAVEFNYGLLLEERAISLWSYNLETVLAEKLQTVLARGVLNTRMRDFYDIWMLLSVYEESIDSDTLQRAFAATCKKRETEHLLEKSEEILSNVEVDSQLQTLWKSYQKKFTYATNVTYEDIICSARKLLKIIK